MSQVGDLAREKFLSGYNCSQAVFSAFCEKTGVDENLALKIATGFGAGMGRAQEVCGAISGGIMALGMVWGRGGNDDIKATEATYVKTLQFMEEFSRMHGSVLCKKLLDGCALGSPEGQARFKQEEMKNRICVPCVQDATDIIAKMIS